MSAPYAREPGRVYTVVRVDAHGSPHHRAGRLAREAGAPIVPTAILGTSHLWLGPVPKPRRIDVSFLAPVPADAEELVRRQVERAAAAAPAGRRQAAAVAPPVRLARAATRPGALSAASGR